MSKKSGTDKKLPLLVVISGPSGAGKSIILKKLLSSSRRYAKVASFTTKPVPRRARSDEEYHYLSPKKFADLRASGKFLETARVHGYLFGTLAADPIRIVKSGKVPLKIIDVKGFAKVRRLKQYRLCSIFVVADGLAELKKRIITREPDIPKAQVAERLATARRELAHKNEYDHVVANKQGRIREALAEIQGIIDNCRRSG